MIVIRRAGGGRPGTISIRYGASVTVDDSDEWQR